MQILLDEIFLKCHMAISRVDFGSLITELVTRNPILGIPPHEDGRFANLLIFDYLYYIFV